jgi:hypothetical protein
MLFFCTIEQQRRLTRRNLIDELRKAKLEVQKAQDKVEVAENAVVKATERYEDLKAIYDGLENEKTKVSATP